MKQAKPLTKEQYLKKFSRAVRWRLPPQESEDAISDYRELIFQEERDEAKLVEELGEPVQAAHLLTDVKTCRRWLKIFAVLAVGLFLLAKWAWMARSSVYLSFAEEWWYPVWVMAVGLPLSLYWFRRYGQKNGPLSKRLLLALAVVLVAGCGILFRLWQLSGVNIFEEIPGGAIGFQKQIYELVTVMMCTGVLAALAGLVGLIQAKCRDRRWLALYVLGVTVAVLVGFIEFNMTRMDVDWIPTIEEFRAYLMARLLPIGAVGLLGTGVALC